MSFGLSALAALSFVQSLGSSLYAAPPYVSIAESPGNCTLPESLPSPAELLQRHVATAQESEWGINSIVYGCMSIPFEQVWEFFSRDSGLDEILTGYSFTIPAVAGTIALNDIPWPQAGAVRRTLFDPDDPRTLVTGLWAEERVDEFSKSDARFLYRVYAFDSLQFERILDHIVAQFNFRPLPGGMTLVTWSYTLVPVANKAVNRKILTAFTRYQLHPYMVEALARVMTMMEAEK